MKEVKKQFKLEEYNQLLADGKELNKDFRLETRDKRKVTRLLCTDKKHSEYPIVGCVENNNKEEETHIWSVNGYRGFNDDLDLMIVTYEEEKYRPYKTAKEVFEDCIKHHGWVKSKDTEYYCAVLFIDNVYITLCDDDYCFFSYKELLDDYVWADDETPCGVEEE